MKRFERYKNAFITLQNDRQDISLFIYWNYLIY